MNSLFALSLRYMSAAALLLIALLLAPNLALAALHKPATTVAGAQVMLSDVFEGIPFEKDKVLAAAPAPGRQLTYNARDLAALARVHGLDWQAQSTGDSAVITRASQSFDAAAISQAVSDEIAKQGLTRVQGHTSVTLDNTAVTLTAPADKTVAIAVDNLTLTPNNQRFSAIARVTAEGQTLTQAPVTGRITTLISVPVLARLAKKGDVIKASDLGWQDVELDAANADVVTDADDLIGKTPRNNLRPGLPLRSIDLLTPAVITKGSQVNLSYRTGSIQITAAGKALADGAEGDVIRVVNLTSSRTLEGRVVNSGTVRVDLEPRSEAALPAAMSNN